MGSGLGQYYLASAFDKIFMQPIGSVNVSGLFIEIPYARALLDKVGIEPQIEARKEYKSVFSSVTDTEITKPVKEMMTALLKDINDKMLADIAEDRSFLLITYSVLSIRACSPISRPLKNSWWMNLFTKMIWATGSNRMWPAKTAMLMMCGLYRLTIISLR